MLTITNNIIPESERKKMKNVTFILYVQPALVFLSRRLLFNIMQINICEIITADKAF